MSRPPGGRPTGRRRGGALAIRTLAEINGTLLRGLGAVPQDVDVVVPASRWCFAPALLLALYRHSFVAAPADGGRLRVLRAGQRMGESPAGDPAAARRALLVQGAADDSAEARAARRAVERAVPSADVFHLALHAKPCAAAVVDEVLELTERDSVFAWQLLHDPVLRGAVVSLEGVLCPVPGGDGTLPPLASVAPLARPSAEVGVVVSEQPAWRRDEVRQWLDRHGIRCRAIAFPAPDRGHEPASIAAWKADVIAANGSEVAVEGDAEVAALVAERAGRPVLCWPDQQVFAPGPQPPTEPVRPSSGFRWAWSRRHRRPEPQTPRHRPGA